MELKRIANKAVITFFIILHLPKQSAQKYTSFTYYSKLSDYLVKYFMGKIKKAVAGNPYHDSFFLAGAVGLEPTTNGFGDRYSTN